jgi:hypothetical protein
MTSGGGMLHPEADGMALAGEVSAWRCILSLEKRREGSAYRQNRGLLITALKRDTPHL